MKIDRLIDNLFANIDVLQKALFERYDFKLLKDIEFSNVVNIKGEVKNLDSLRLRITDITTQIIENFNKKKFDENTGLNSKGSIESFKNFLKHNYHEEAMFIEEDIHGLIWALYNVRTNFAHKKNRNYRKALSILSVNEFETDPAVIWYACVEGLNSAIENTITLIMKTPEKEDYVYFEELTLEKMKSDYKVNISNLINDNPQTKPYLLYLINIGSIEDIDLAKLFNHSINHVRHTLYPVIGEIILYRIDDECTIQIYILEEVKSILKEVLNNED